jgi:chromosome segregation ATPase
VRPAIQQGIFASNDRFLHRYVGPQSQNKQCRFSSFAVHSAHSVVQPFDEVPSVIVNIKSVENAIKSVEDKLNSVEIAIKTVEDKINSLENEIKAIKAEIITLEDGLTGDPEKDKLLIKKIDRLNEDKKELSVKQNKLSVKQNKLQDEKNKLQDEKNKLLDQKNILLNKLPAEGPLPADLQSKSE